ncbi:MAG: aliphatic sulfonate ABC transporter substrate-binding protein [Alphaproteobacteria bacterium]|nr:aliphatic sulfonate ABC transporter substrate-binding protein [Alphaproteobacteria bacterium]
METAMRLGMFARLAPALLALVLAAPMAHAQAKKVRLDYAYYNPVSLVLKEKGWLEQELQSSGIAVEWVFSQGSNKSLEYLNGRSVDFGSTAGAAALIARANGIPIKGIYIYSKPEWTALVTKKDSAIRSVADLKGKRIAVTRGTDPYIFLLRALDKNKLTDKDVKIVLLQHPDGKTALERGDVDAWAGLDPFMAQTELESGSRLFFRDADANTYGFLNVREDFLAENAELAARVLAVYERGRKWALANPDELKAILAKAAKLTDAVAAKQLERTDLTNPRIGDVHREAVTAAGLVLQKGGVIPAEADVKALAGVLVDTRFAAQVAGK